MAAVIRRRLERFADRVGREERRAARLAVRERRLDRHSQIRLGRHVRDRVVDEDRVELTAEPDGAHVALDVLALRVQRAAHRQHAR